MCNAFNSGSVTGNSQRNIESHFVNIERSISTKITGAYIYWRDKVQDPWQYWEQ